MEQELADLINYIETHLEEVPDTQRLSKMLFKSRMQMHRDFCAATGHSVKAYVNKRRLSNALALIKLSKISLSETAYRTGYSSQQAMCRAVRQELGMSPLAYRKSPVYWFFPPCRGKPSMAVSVSEETVPRRRCIRFYKEDCTGIEEEALHALEQAVPDYDGRIFGRNDSGYGTHACYELYVTEPEAADPVRLAASELEAGELCPAWTGTLAAISVSCRHAPDPAAIAAAVEGAWDYLFRIWLPGSMFVYTGEPYWEEHVRRGGKTVKVRLLLPVRRRKDFLKITLCHRPGLHFVTACRYGPGAEEAAAAAVVCYMDAHAPLMLQASREFLAQKRAQAYMCGVRVHSDRPLGDGRTTEDFHTDAGEYLVLESGGIIDYDCCAEMLLEFAGDNGFRIRPETIFSVYDTGKSFDNPEYRMYCRLKTDTK